MKNLQPLKLSFVIILMTLSPLFGVAAEALNIYMAQVKVRPGQFDATLQDIANEYQKALAANADMMVLPEGIIPGYPSNDTLFEGDYIERAEKATRVVQEMTQGHSTAILLGHIGKSAKPRGRALQNFVSLFENGQRIYRQAKMLLPTYGPFDDSRYFERGDVKDLDIVNFRGHRIGILICEDGWFYDTDANGRLIYRHNTLLKMKRLKPDFVFSISASPANQGKQKVRFDVFSHVAKFLDVPLLYINQYGMVDGVLFDGASFFLSRTGELISKLIDYGADTALIKVFRKTLQVVTQAKPADKPQSFVLQSLEFGLHEFARAHGYESAVVVFDGSLESQLTLTLAARSLGAEKTFVVLKPLRLMTAEERDTALSLAQKLGLPSHNKIFVADGTPAQIEFFMSQLPAVLQTATLQKELGESDSRWRKLFALKPLALQTVNKEALATQIPQPLSRAGVLAPLADLYKSDVLNLSQILGLTAESASESQLAFERLLKDLIKGNLTRDQIRKNHISLGLETINATFAAYDNTEFSRQTASGVVLRVTNTPLARGEARKVMNGVREGFVPTLEQVVKTCRAATSL